MTSGSQIDYEALAQDAMRGLVRTVLQNIERDGGLPGEHHFYIAFDTEADGVDLSKRIKEQYPQEMTIVLQHRFWDLAVRDEDFEVKLTFDGIPERLCVPFAAIKVFFDPSVPYGLQFEAPGSADGEAAQPAPAVPMPVPDSDSEDSSGPGRRAPSSVPSAGAARKKPKAAASKDDDAASNAKPPLVVTDDPSGQGPAADADGHADADNAAAGDDAAPASAEVVQLDAFRKKT